MVMACVVPAARIALIELKRRPLQSRHTMSFNLGLAGGIVPAFGPAGFVVQMAQRFQHPTIKRLYPAISSPVSHVYLDRNRQ
jgi:hypothetical protein